MSSQKHFWAKALRQAQLGEGPASLTELMALQASLASALAGAGKGPLGSPDSLMDLGLPTHDIANGHLSCSFGDTTAAIDAMLTALGMEASELRDWLPWKSWKNYGEMDGTEIEDRRREAAVEAVDILFFLLNIFILLGVSPKMIASLYKVKLEENLRRVADDY